MAAGAPEVSGVRPAGAETTSSDNHYYYLNLVLFDELKLVLLIMIIHIVTLVNIIIIIFI